jgi:hypothetical protein
MKGGNMSLSVYQVTIPPLTRMLHNLDAILEKAAAHCSAHSIEPEALLRYRLYPDMFPFIRQVQLACDHAKNAAARLTGREAPEFANDEQDFAALKTRVGKTIAYLQSFSPADFEGAENREVVIRRGETVTTYRGEDFLLNRALPNFYFHVTTAYAILRHNGVALGKRDYLGR